MKHGYVIVSKNRGTKDWVSFVLPNERHVNVMPREQFERACAAAGEQLKKSIDAIRHGAQVQFQGVKNGL